MALMQKLTSVLVASSLVLSLVGTALAADPPAQSGQSACDRMIALKVLNGKAGDNACALDEEISRAELVTIMVRAFGQGENAALLNGAAAFTDTATHWASGSIAMAKNLVEAAGGDSIGMPDGTFNPDGKVTPAQAVAFLMKFLGVKADPAKSWPSSYLDPAVELGVITGADRDALSTTVDANAGRGVTFYILDRAFYNYDLGGGKTLYTKYVDPSKPEITLDSIETTVSDPEVAITGVVNGAADVTVGSEKVTVAADGKFSSTLKLPELKSYTVSISAVNIAGGKSEQSLTITRINGDAATVEAKLGEALLKAAATTDLTVTVKDKNGETIKDAAFDVKVEGEIGTYAGGKFTAADKPATGKLIVTAANAIPAELEVAVIPGDLSSVKVTGASTARIGQAVTFTAKGYDIKENEVTLTDVSWSSSTGSVIGASTGEFVGTASTSVLVTAKAGGKEGTAIIQVFGDAKALAMDVSTGLIANGTDTKTISVKVVDASGALVGNDATKITLSLGGGSKLMLKDANGNNQPSVTTAAVNGVATFTVYQPSDLGITDDFKVSTASLSAIGGTLTGAVGTISSVAPTVGSVVLSTNPAATVIDAATQSIEVIATFFDATGIQIIAPAAFTVTLSNSNTTVGTLSTTTLYVDAGQKSANGAATLMLTQKEGDITLSGTTSAGYTVTPVTFTTKNAGPAYRLAVVSAPKDTSAGSDEVVMQVALQDATGTTKSGMLSTPHRLTATAKHESGRELTVRRSKLRNGVATFRWRNYKALRQAGTWTFSVAADAADGYFAPPAVTAKVTPGVVDHLGYVMFDGEQGSGYLAADGTMTGTISVQMQDQWNNTVTGDATAVTFKKVTVPAFEGDPIGGRATTGVDATGVTVNAVNGVASVTVTATIAEGVDGFVASAKKPDGTLYPAYNSAQYPRRVYSEIAGAPVTLDLWFIAKEQTAGEDFDVRFAVVDGSTTCGVFNSDCIGRRVVTDNGRSVTLDIMDGENTVVKTLTGITKNGQVTFKVNLTKADGYTLKASANINGAVKSATAETLVNPGVPARAVVKALRSGVEQGTHVGKNIRLMATDEYGNEIKRAWFDNFEPTVNGVEDSGIVEQDGPESYYFEAPAEVERGYIIDDADGTVSVCLQGRRQCNRNTAAVDEPEVSAQRVRRPVEVPLVPTTITTHTAGPNYTLGVVQSTASVTAGGEVTIEVGVYDASGHLKTGVKNLRVYLEGDGNNPDEGYGDSATTVAGIATFTFNSYQAGTYVYSAYTDTDMLTVADIKVVVNAGAPDRVAGDSIDLEANGSSLGLVKFRVTDDRDNTITSYSGTMNFTLEAGGSGATLLNSSAPIVNGVAIAQVQASNTAGKLTIKATIDGNTDLDQENAIATVTVGALAPSSLRSTLTISDSSVYVALRDANGNAIGHWETRLIQVNGTALPGTQFTEIGESGVYTATKAAGATGVRVNAADGTTELFTLPYPAPAPTIN